MGSASRSKTSKGMLTLGPSSTSWMKKALRIGTKEKLRG
jgi:hypothetical protein